jgi:hypothetical protein
MRNEEFFIRVLDRGGNLGGLSLMVCDSKTALVYVSRGCVKFILNFQGKV